MNKIWTAIIVNILLCSSCEIGAPLEDCNYNVRLSFYYSNYGGVNQLRDYVTSMTDYLYDAQGRLVSVATRTKAQVLTRTVQLPPGDYTLVSWGNLAEKTAVTPSSPEGMLCEDMGLRQDNPATQDAAIQYNGERLHYARVEFNVPPSGVIRRTVYAGHAYLNLKVTVAGLSGAKGQDYTMRLDGTHPGYGFTHYNAVGTQGFTMYVPRLHREETVPHLVPGCRGNGYGEIYGEFVAARLTGETVPVFSLWQGDKQVLRNVELKTFFDTMLIDMDNNECQDFEIRITVDGDRIYVQFVTLGDWIDGGSFG